MKPTLVGPNGVPLSSRRMLFEAFIEDGELRFVPDLDTLAYVMETIGVQTSERMINTIRALVDQAQIAPDEALLAMTLAATTYAIAEAPPPLPDDGKPIVDGDGNLVA